MTKPLPREQLELAWRQMRRPATWPASLDAALADPARARCLEGYARALHLRRAPFGGPAPSRAHTLPAAPVPATPTAPPTRKARAAHPPRFDPRKAAANDHDE